MAELDFNGYSLSHMLDVRSPDNDESAGYEFLMDILNAYNGGRDEIFAAKYPSDYMSEMADTLAASLNTRAVWEVVVDLDLVDRYTPEVELNLSWDTLTDDFRGVLDELAGSLLRMLHSEDESEDSDDDDSEDETDSDE